MTSWINYQVPVFQIAVIKPTNHLVNIEMAISFRVKITAPFHRENTWINQKLK
jgi:hypothetical protein